MNIALLNMILYNFLESKLSCVVIFQCWPTNFLQQFVVSATYHQLYAQYVDLNNMEAYEDIAHKYLHYRRPKLGIFMDMNCKGTESVIEQASKFNLYNQRYHWIIYDQYSNMTRFNGLFRNKHLSVDADMTFVLPKFENVIQIIDDFTFVMFDVYNNGFHLGGQLNVTSNYEMHCNCRGCHVTKYLSDLHKRSLYGNRDSLKDITFRVAVVVTRFDVNAPPKEIIKYLLAPKDFHIDPLARFGFQMLKLLQESLYTNFSYTFHDRWTDVEVSGGIVGELINETADLTSAPFFMTRNRLRYLTPVLLTGEFRSVCMFRTPRNSGMHGGVFLEPFSTKVWLFFCCILSLAATMLWLSFLVECQKLQRYFHNFMPSFLTTCLIAFGSACAQSSFLIPRSLGGRLAFISLSIICFLIYNYYTSVVVSSLLASPVKSKLKTLGDLANSDLEVGLEPLPYTYTYLNFSNLPDVQRFVSNKISSVKNFESLWYSASAGIEKMRKKIGFVFIFETSNGFELIERSFEPYEICDLNEILFRSDTKLVTHLHHNSSYKEIVRLKLLRILETGVHAKHRLQWVRTHLTCISNSFVINVGLEYTAPLFLMLISAYALVVMLFILEVIWKRWEKKSRGH